MEEDVTFMPFSEVKDEFWGPVGTPKRDRMERSAAASAFAWRLGQALKAARERENLTQEQLGERVGVKKSAISRLERGYAMTIPTMARVFQAVGVRTATVNLGSAGQVELW